MLVVPEEIKELFKTDGIKKYARVTFPNGDHEEFGNEKIVSESVKFKESICSEAEFKFGLCEASQLSFDCYGVKNIKGFTIRFELGIDTKSLGNEYENPYYISYGEFIVSSCRKDGTVKNKRTVTAYSNLTSGTAYFQNYMKNMWPNSTWYKQTSFNITDDDINKLLFPGNYSDDLVEITDTNVTYGMTMRDKNNESVSIIFHAKKYDLNTNTGRKIIFGKTEKDKNWDNEVNDFIKHVTNYTGSTYVSPISSFDPKNAYSSPHEDIYSYFDSISFKHICIGNIGYGKNLGYGAQYNQLPLSSHSKTTAEHISYDYYYDRTYKYNYDIKDLYAIMFLNMQQYEGSTYTMLPYKDGDYDFPTHISLFLVPTKLQFAATRYDPITGSYYREIIYETSDYNDKNKLYYKTFDVGSEGNPISTITSTSQTDDINIINYKYTVRDRDTFYSTRKDYYFNWPNKFSDGKKVVEDYCELNGSFGKIGRDGKFKEVKLDQWFDTLYPSNILYPSKKVYPSKDIVNKTDIITASEYSSLFYEDTYSKPYGRIIVEYTDSNDNTESYIHYIVPPEEYDSNIYQDYVINNNSYIIGVKRDIGYIEELTSNLGKKINNIKYVPYEMTMVSRPYLEAGDPIKFIDVDGTSFYSYILSKSTEGIQTLEDEYECPIDVEN